MYIPKIVWKKQWRNLASIVIIGNNKSVNRKNRLDEHMTSGFQDYVINLILPAIILKWINVLNK